MTRVSTASPFRPLCDCCERERSSDWIVARQRFECDDCQRDHETETEE